MSTQVFLPLLHCYILEGTAQARITLEDMMGLFE